MNTPRAIYPITMSDLVDIADAASDLDAMKAFYVDRPDEQKIIGDRAQRLQNIVQRAAAWDENLVDLRSKERITA